MFPTAVRSLAPTKAPHEELKNKGSKKRSMKEQIFAKDYTEV